MIIPYMSSIPQHLESSDQLEPALSVPQSPFAFIFAVVSLLLEAEGSVVYSLLTNAFYRMKLYKEEEGGWYVCYAMLTD